MYKYLCLNINFVTPTGDRNKYKLEISMCPTGDKYKYIYKLSTIYEESE